LKKNQNTKNGYKNKNKNKKSRWAAAGAREETKPLGLTAKEEQNNNNILAVELTSLRQVEHIIETT